MPFLVTALVAAFFIFTNPVVGHESLCSLVVLRDELLEQLDEKYQEEVLWRGINNTGKMVEIVVSQETGTFTLIISRPDGWACVVTVGDGSKLIKPKGGTL